MEDLGVLGLLLSEVIDNKLQTSSSLFQEGSAPGNCWGFHSGCVFEARGHCRGSCSLFCNSFPFKKFIFLTRGVCIPGATLALPVSSSCSLHCKLSQLQGNSAKKICVFLSFPSCPSSSEVQRRKNIRNVFMVYETPNGGSCALGSLPFRLLLAGACP